MGKSSCIHMDELCYELWSSMMSADETNSCAIIPLNNQSPSFTIYTQLSSANAELLIECRKPIEEGYYSFSIWNEKGRAIQQQDLWIDKDARSMNLEVPGMISGNYYLQIRNPENGYAFRERITIDNKQ